MSNLSLVIADVAKKAKDQLYDLKE